MFTAWNKVSYDLYNGEEIIFLIYFEGPDIPADGEMGFG